MPSHSLDEVLGFDEEKKKLRICISANELKELSDFLELPSVHSFFFYGPPGCGKPYVIMGFIHELMDKGYKCLKVSSADIHAKFSGEADKRLEALFDEAIAQDNCVIFIDEIDGICQNREIPNLADHNMQLTTTFLNCFNKLVEAGKQKKSIFFFSATNYPSNVDSAMLDRVMLVQIPMPDEELREGLFRNLLNRVKLDSEISFADFAEKSEGYSVRDIERIVSIVKQQVFNGVVEKYSYNENIARSAVEAIKKGDYVITRKMLDAAFGSYKPKPMTDVERSLIEFESRT
jgi:AAA+ superfamily predicted ATPase